VFLDSKDPRALRDRQARLDSKVKVDSWVILDRQEAQVSLDRQVKWELQDSLDCKEPLV